MLKERSLDLVIGKLIEAFLLMILKSAGRGGSSFWSDVILIKVFGGRFIHSLDSGDVKI